MEENEKKAFDFAADTTKQLMTIATGITALMVTFLKDVLGGTENAPTILLMATWGMFIVSILFGILTLMALTGTLQPLKANDTTTNSTPTIVVNPNQPNPTESTPQQINNSVTINIYKKNIRVLSGLQFLTFFGAILLTGIFGYESFSNKQQTNSHKNTYKVIRTSILNKDTSKKYIDTLYLPKP